jgi:hypothetical protein
LTHPSNSVAAFSGLRSWTDQVIAFSVLVVRAYIEQPSTTDKVVLARCLKKPGLNSLSEKFTCLWLPNETYLPWHLIMKQWRDSVCFKRCFKQINRVMKLCSASVSLTLRSKGTRRQSTGLSKHTHLIVISLIGIGWVLHTSNFLSSCRLRTLTKRSLQVLLPKISRDVQKISIVSSKHLSG